MTYAELAAEEVVALPERALLEPLTIVAPVQLVAAANVAFIETDDVEGDVVVVQENDVEAYQDTFAIIVND